MLELPPPPKVSIQSAPPAALASRYESPLGYDTRRRVYTFKTRPNETALTIAQFFDVPAAFIPEMIRVNRRMSVLRSGMPVWTEALRTGEIITIPTPWAFPEKPEHPANIQAARIAERARAAREGRPAAHVRRRRGPGVLNSLGGNTLGCDPGYHFDFEEFDCVPDSNSGPPVPQGNQPGDTCTDANGNPGTINAAGVCIPWGAPNAGQGCTDVDWLEGTIDPFGNCIANNPGPVPGKGGQDCYDKWGNSSSTNYEGECIDLGQPPAPTNCDPGDVLCGGNCIGCGPNTTVNPNDCGCDCLPGFEPVDINVPGSGCKKKVANPNPPNPNPPNPNPPNPNTPASTKEEKSNTLLYVGGGVLTLLVIGGVVVAVTAKKKKEKKAA